ncbi:energy transducer TonB [Hymenobacter sp. BT507]|uniref:Energy transducer TonB n=1 Tax=Hymenobacter citatus TaxID=2763506 RepID=A0ABR7MGI8_9BACT|nr:energy transducer TonB [Hymenobacter citatus]MBC6610189.1 energy transducer TonB [Hymenobacter citatus]
MNTLHLPTATLDDIVFEGRNKAYGAFVLRRLYNQHLTRAALIAFSLFLLLVSIPLLVNVIWPTAIADVLPPVLDDPGMTFTEVDLPAIKQPEAAVAPPAPVVVTPPRELIPTRIVPDEQVKLEPVKATPLTAPTDGILGDVPKAGVIGGSATGKVGATDITGTGLSDSGKTVAAPPAQPFIHAEVMPEFAGGSDALRKFMQKNLRYPTQALSNNIAGKVYVSFVVNTDGSITNVEVVKGLGYGTDEEAMRVIRKMPAWTPGRQNSHTVPVRYTMPITFRYE